MDDRIETIGNGSLIQHGKYNDRVYLMKLAENDCPEILEIIRGLAMNQHYSKIFAKIPSSAAPYFFSDGYIMEAFIPGFYSGRQDAFFVSKYLNSDRLMDIEQSSLEELGAMLQMNLKSQGKDKPVRKTEKRFKIRPLNSSHVKQITSIYREVFSSYPFPIHNPGYILKTMKENVSYYGAETKGRIVAVASAEIDEPGKNAEMTDFATLSGFRGNNLATRLLRVMENKMKKSGIQTLYTIARLNSPPMNKIFLNLHYIYAGTLIKNTNIAGEIESMNVLYKQI
jgi:putative beta-lysine N-acetyltransferase